MARHRDFKKIDVSEERAEYDDYGHSVDDSAFCLSPSSEQYMFPRAGDKSQRLLHDFLFDGSTAMAPVPEELPQPVVKENNVQEKPPIISVVPKQVLKPSSTDMANGRPSSPHVVVKSGSKMTAGFNVVNPSPGSSSCISGMAAQLDHIKIDTSPPGTRSDSPSRSSAASTSKSQSAGTPRIKVRPVGGKPLLNLVVVGHVDAGKSTLMGHFLYLLGGVNQKTMHKYKQESQKLGKGSFAFAWVLDEGAEERSRGVTMDIARTRFSTDRFEVVLLDAPGHRDFIPNMISGAAQADAAILVVNATTGEFETGFDFGGQTREHTMLIRSLGVSQVAVAVNKLDTVDWSKERFDDVESKLKSFLKQTGFSDVAFVPCCGLNGENLVKPVEPDHPLSRWYRGLTLLQVIDNFKPPERSVDKPLRLCIGDIFKGMTSTSLISGKVETGAIQVNDKVLVMPSGDSAVVKGVQTDEGIDAGVAYAGDQSNVSLLNIDLSNVTVGDVICHPESPIWAGTRFEAKLVFFNVVRPITKGYLIVIHCNSIQRSGIISKLITQINQRNGDVIKQKPRCFSKNTSGVVEIAMDRPICLEVYSNCKELGRVTLRSDGVTIAAGVVTKLIPFVPSAD